MTTPYNAGDAAADFLQRLKDGDEVAWQQLTAEFSPKLLKYVRKQLPTPEDAEDVVSDTLIALVKAIPSFDGQDPLIRFIYSVTNRKIADFWRKKIEVKSDISPEVPNLLSGMEHLPIQARQALLLRYQTGLSISEIANMLGRTFKATESLIKRAQAQVENGKRDTVQHSYFNELLLSRYPQIGQVALPIVEAITNQERKCESRGSAEEAVIFQKCAEQLIAMSEVPRLAEIHVE